MNNLVKKIIIGGMVVAGTGLMADAYLRTDGKMDKGAKVEHLGGLSLILGDLQVQLTNQKTLTKFNNFSIIISNRNNP